LLSSAENKNYFIHDTMDVNGNQNGFLTNILQKCYDLQKSV